MKTLVVVLACAVVTSSHAAFDLMHPGARVLGVGGVTTVLHANEWASFCNPALLRSIKKRTISFSFAPHQFGLNELRSAAGAYVEPTSFGSFALSGATFGFELYRETTVGMSYGVKVADLFSVGASTFLYSLNIPSYGSAISVGVSVGATLSLSHEIAWGVSLQNINAPTIGVAKEKLPQMFSTGLAYNPIPETVLVVELAKDVRFPLSLRAGVEYTFIQIVSIRGGLSSEPSTLHGGLGVEYSFFKIDYAAASHVDLGLTHHFSLSVAIGLL